MRDSGVSLRYDKLKQEMKKQNFDVVIAISPENVLYFSETYIQTQKSIRDRLAIAVLPLEQDPAMIACVIEEPTVENECWIKDRRYYFEFRESPSSFWWMCLPSGVFLISGSALRWIIFPPPITASSCSGCPT